MRDQDELLKEFLITTADELFRDIQDKMAIEDGGFCALYWPDSAAFRDAFDAVKATGFQVGDEQAFSQPMPAIPVQPDLEPDSLRAIAQAHLTNLGKVVGADLATGPHVDSHARMLGQYIQAEKDFAAEYAPKP